MTLLRPSLRRSTKIAWVLAQHALAFLVRQALVRFPAFRRRFRREFSGGAERLRIALRELWGASIKPSRFWPPVRPYSSRYCPEVRSVVPGPTLFVWRLNRHSCESWANSAGGFWRRHQAHVIRTEAALDQAVHHCQNRLSRYPGHLLWNQGHAVRLCL